MVATMSTPLNSNVPVGGSFAFMRIYTILGDRYAWAMEPLAQEDRQKVTVEATTYVLLFKYATGLGFTQAFSAYLRYPNNMMKLLGLDC